MKGYMTSYAINFKFLPFFFFLLLLFYTEYMRIIIIEKEGSLLCPKPTKQVELFHFLSGSHTDIYIYSMETFLFQL